MRNLAAGEARFFVPLYCQFRVFLFKIQCSP